MTKLFYPITKMFWYWTWVISVIVKNDQSNPYAQRAGYKWTRWDEIKTSDGPLHSLWCWWGRLTINWFTIGWHCWRKGHNWRGEYGGWNRELKIEAGRASYTDNYHRATITTCAYCGKYRGRTI